MSLCLFVCFRIFCILLCEQTYIQNNWCFRVDCSFFLIKHFVLKNVFCLYGKVCTGSFFLSVWKILFMSLKNISWCCVCGVCVGKPNLVKRFCPRFLLWTLCLGLGKPFKKSTYIRKTTLFNCNTKWFWHHCKST